MKTIKLLFASIFIFVFVACQEDKPVTNQRQKSNNDLEGSWTLVNVSGGFAGMTNNFQPGWILWTFNPTTQLISISNNNPMENSLHDGFETGNYPFSNNTTTSSCENNYQPLSITTVFDGCYSITNNTLTIRNAQIADGFQYTLVRFNDCDNQNNYLIFGRYYGFCGGENCIEKFI
jgi:hypothetical protein